jgi:hypothetical protein
MVVPQEVQTPSFFQKFASQVKQSPEVLSQVAQLTFLEAQVAHIPSLK